MNNVLVVGAGPAGLMAAEVLAAAGVAVDVADAMPSVGRKFLLAGKGGLNCNTPICSKLIGTVTTTCRARKRSPPSVTSSAPSVCQFTCQTGVFNRISKPCASNVTSRS